jgi:hypothetical protein
MNFSRIEDLYLAQEERIFYERMQTELPSLKKLSLAWVNSGSNVPQDRVEFIKSVPPLESLSISIGAPYYYSGDAKNRTRFPLTEILEIHGSTLKCLVLKQSETNEAKLRRPMLTVDEVNGIGASCPNLQHFTLDIDRDGSYGWPNATLDAVTNVTSLESLTLRLELGADLHDVDEWGAYGRNPQGLNGPNEWFREPRMSLEVAESLFRQLSAKKIGKELKRVVFEVGDIADKPYSGSLYFPSWEEGRARSFVCKLSSEDGSNCTVHG